MEKEILEKLINEGNSLNKIAEITNKALTTIRYWSAKHGLKSKHPTISNRPKTEYGEFRYCYRCEKDIPTKDFYQRRGKANASVYCKKCTGEQTIERQRNLKIKMVEYKGGKCSVLTCGYNTYIGALEFHHLDPTKKDFTLAHVKLYSFNETIKKELDKCILVCSNCHREIHAGLIDDTKLK